jgi:CyaY protein
VPAAPAYTRFTTGHKREILVSIGTVTRVSSLGDAEYRALADALLARIEANADRWLQDDLVDVDAQRTGGLLELLFPNGSKLVINTQPPLHEVWLAARGGGFHFRWAGDAWRDTRDGRDFETLFAEHASAQSGVVLALA